MLPLGLFGRDGTSRSATSRRSRCTGDSGVVFFLLVLFLQEVAGYGGAGGGPGDDAVDDRDVPALEAGRPPCRPVRSSPVHGPRADDGGGRPGVLMLRIGAHVDYFTELLPALLVFSVGLACTVAPLTATVLSDADEGNAGIASGVNNAIARVAGLLAIAGVGAVISAQFASSLDAPACRPDRIPGRPPSRRPGAKPDARAGRPGAGRAELSPTPSRRRRFTLSTSASASRQCSSPSAGCWDWSASATPAWSSPAPTARAGSWREQPRRRGATA